MMFKTHLLFALLISLLIFNYFDLNPILFIFILIISAVVPDIDHSKSWIGRKFKPLSLIVNFIFGHRKLIHSLFFVILMSFLIKISFNNYHLPFFVGYLSHLFLDSLTKQGIMLFYPFKFRVNGFLRTNGITEKIFLIVLALINAVLFIKYIL